MARYFFRPVSDLTDRSGYYLLIGLIGFTLLFIDQRTEVFRGLRESLNSMTSALFIVSGETRRRVRSQFLTVQSQQKLARRIEQLEAVNARLRVQIIDRNAVFQENRQLRNQLQLEIRQQARLLFAEVNAINYRPGFGQSIIINQGTDEGIVAGQAVIADLGVIGQTTQVLGSSSKVLLITDKSHALPVLLKESQHRLIAEGTGADGFLIIHDLDARKEIQRNELVLTSGLGDIFPAGYPVGQVDSIQLDNITGLQEIRIKPFIDITTIQYVFVVLDKSLLPAPGL